MDRRHRHLRHRPLGGQARIGLGVEDDQPGAKGQKRQHQPAGGMQAAMAKTAARQMHQGAQKQHRRQHRYSERRHNPVPLERRGEGHMVLERCEYQRLTREHLATIPPD